MRQWIWAIVFLLGSASSGLSKTVTVKNSLCGAALGREILSFTPSKYTFDETPLNGVLVEVEGRRKVIALGHYFTRGHLNILADLNKRYTVSRVLWAGEVLVNGREDEVEVLAVNETSGTLQKLMDGHHRLLANLSEGVAVENDIAHVQSLTSSARLLFSEHTTYENFNENSQHLIQELNAMPGNSRHSIGSITTVATSYIELFARGREMDEETADEMLEYLDRLTLYIDAYIEHELPSITAPIDHVIAIKNANDQIKAVAEHVRSGGRSFDGALFEGVSGSTMMLGQLVGGQSSPPIVFEASF